MQDKSCADEEFELATAFSCTSCYQQAFYQPELLMCGSITAPRGPNATYRPSEGTAVRK